MPAVPFGLLIEHEEIETEVINKETIVNKRTNEQLSVLTHQIDDSPLKIIEVRRNRAPKKKAKNSQNC